MIRILSRPLPGFPARYLAGLAGSVPAALLALGFGLSAASAQTTAPAPAETPATETPAAEAPAAPAAEAAEAEPQTYLAAEHRDWQVLCARMPEGQPEICEIYQLLTEANGQPIAEISIAALDPSEQIVAGATITTPLETFLPTGLGFRIGDVEQMRVEPFRVCTVIGCVVRLGISGEEIASMQNGSHAWITIAPFVAVDRPVDIRISLLGFTAAMADLRARTPNPASASTPAVPNNPVPPADPSNLPATPPAAAD